MGVSISNWRLASTVARSGQLGVISGTALGVLLARGLQDGDPDGRLRRALAAFPEQEIVERILERYFLPGGRKPGAGYRSVPVPRQRATRTFVELAVAGTFAEVFSAKEGHDGLIGINLLEKLQIPILPVLYGAMLADVDFVLMGAGIPVEVPHALDELSQHRPAKYPLNVRDAEAGETFYVTFDPASIRPDPGPPVRRPAFLAIVGSHVLATHLARSDHGRPDGFVVEAPIAGGHNAPPRGPLHLDDNGEPIYGPRDEVDFAKMRDLGLPFWLAGGYGHPDKLRMALEVGACGVQIGTAFALCEESGLEPELKRRARLALAAGELTIKTDPLASPTGFPFKVAQLEGSIADPSVAAMRAPHCDLGYLTTLYRRADGTIGYRCPAEPLKDFVAKGGDESEHDGRVCVCNGLVSAAGMPQLRRGHPPEPPLLTFGDDARAVLAELAPDGGPYHAGDVIDHVLAGVDGVG